MNCEQARELLHDRVDGILAAVDGGRLDDHLSQCDACRRWAEEMGRVQTALGELREASRHFGEEAERPVVGRRQASQWWRPMRIAAALLLATGATLAAWRLMWAGSGGPVSDRSFSGTQLAQRRPVGERSPEDLAQQGSVGDRPAGDLEQQRPVGDRSPGALAQQRPVGDRSPGETDADRRTAVRVTLVGEEADRHFAVPGDSDKPDVHFFRIYRAWGDRADAASPGAALEPSDETSHGT